MKKEILLRAVKLIYPEIKDGYYYNPLISGLVWENLEYVEPTLEQFQSKESEAILIEAKELKKIEINSQRDNIKSKNLFHKVGDEDHYFQRDIISNLAFLNAISGDTAVVGWVTAENKIIDISKSELISICDHIRNRDTRETILARKRKDLLETITTLEEVEAFDITQIIL